MSIASEINRLSGNVSNALTAIAAKGVMIPSGANSDDLASLIAQISGGGGSAVTVTQSPDIGGGVVTEITAVDISSDTVDAAHLLSGYTAHAGNGAPITGQYVPPPAPSLQSKSVTYTPSSSAQTNTITPDTGYDGLDAVTVTVNAAAAGIGTLLATASLGTISTSSTSAADTGKSITAKGVYGYDLLIVECSVDSPTNNRHTASGRLILLTAGTNVSTKNGSTIASVTWNSRLSSAGVTTTRANTTAYGVYAYACTLSDGNTGDNGQAVITLYQRYNSTYTGTINGSYTARVYGVNLYDLIGG